MKTSTSVHTDVLPQHTVSLKIKKNKSLHMHAQAFGNWDMLVIQQHIHKPEFAKRLTDMIDSVVTCKLPKSVLDLPDQPNPYPVFASEAYPAEPDVVKNAARIARYLHNHKHTFTCWKYKNCAKCRLAYRQLSLLTYFTEIHRDPSKEECVPVRKLPGSVPGNELISDPPLIKGKSLCRSW